MSKEQETSDFASVGQTPFPPIYPDTLDRVNFSDEKRWPVSKLKGRLELYEEFIESDVPMQRAKLGAASLIRSLTFELEYKKGNESFKDWLVTQQMEKVVGDGSEQVHE